MKKPAPVFDPSWYSRLILLFALYTLAICPIASVHAGNRPNGRLTESAVYQPQAAKHAAVADDSVPELRQGGPLTGSLGEVATQGEGTLPQVVMAPTRSSFLAKWHGMPNVEGYRLDVSRDVAFRIYVTVYRDLDVGNVTTR